MSSTLAGIEAAASEATLAVGGWGAGGGLEVAQAVASSKMVRARQARSMGFRRSVGEGKLTMSGACRGNVLFNAAGPGAAD
ncbi:MAG TPA: hypothetical protein VLC08_02490 [Chitinolyticbacter sp.]|nr:hypothetical protein [Chitinolyticbacter sp.]